MKASQREKNSRWRSGEPVDGLAFLYNSLVEVALPEGQKKEGWIVAASIEGSQTSYTIEARDGSGDYECPETEIRKLDPKKPNQTPEPTAPSGRGSS